MGNMSIRVGCIMLKFEDSHQKLVLLFAKAMLKSKFSKFSITNDSLLLELEAKSDF